jgi:hypothetical protein
MWLWQFVGEEPDPATMNVAVEEFILNTKLKFPEIRPRLLSVCTELTSKLTSLKRKASGDSGGSGHEEKKKRKVRDKPSGTSKNVKERSSPRKKTR